MAASDAPYQGFGTPIDVGTNVSNVYFEILISRGEDLPQWSMQPIVREFPIPGSFPPKVITQVVGWTPATVTWHLGLASIDDYRRLAAMLTTTQTLTVITNIQTHPATVHRAGGVTYEMLPGTTLKAIANPVRDPEGVVELDATFSRIVHPTTFQVVT